jgi:hypothetical protein
VAVGGTTWWWTRGRQDADNRAPEVTRNRLGLLGTAGALLAVAAVSAEWVGRTVASYRGGVGDYDSIQYHLPIAALLARSGWLTRLYVPGVDPVQGFHPSLTELVNGLGFVAFHHDVLAPLFNLGWLALLFLAGWCIGRRAGVAPLTMAAAAAVAAVPIFAVTSAGTAESDVASLALLLAAVALLVDADGHLAALGCAGLAAGLAVATKETVLVPALALTVMVIVLAFGNRVRVLLAWTGPAVVAAIFWPIRNWVRTGSPYPTLHLRAGGLGFPSPTLPTLDHFDSRLITYAFNGSAWRHVFRPGLDIAFRAGGEALLVLSVLGVIAALIWGTPLARGLGVVAAVSAVGYTITPWTAVGAPGHPDLTLFLANTRYALPALLLACAAGGLTAARLPRQWLVAVLGGVVACVLIETADTFRPPRSSDFFLGLMLVIVVLAAGWLAGGWLAQGGLAHLGQSPVRLGVMAGGVLGLLIAGLIIPPVTRTYTDHRYRTTSVAQQQVEFWTGRTLHHQRIGIAGLTFGYLLAGPTVSNDIIYIGQPTPHGGMVEIGSCRDWRGAVNSRHLDYLAVGPPDWDAAASAPPTAAWTGADPSAQVVQHGGNAWLFKLRGPLNPATCQT